MSTEAPKNQITEVIESIRQHRANEDRGGYTNLAVARYDTMYGSRNISFWLVVRPDHGAIQGFNQQLGGGPNINVGKATTMKPHEGKVFSRDSKMGGALTMASESSWSYTPLKGETVQMELNSKCEYVPSYTRNGDAHSITISTPQIEAPYSFSSLKSILGKIQAVKLEEEEQEKKLQQLKADSEGQVALANHLEKLNKTQQELATLIDKRQRFIINQATLRIRPILDPYQERVKRSGFFDDTIVVIDGGPGTGKTTSLIQRIKYLTDPQVLDENMPQKGRNYIPTIANPDNPSWLFLSPSDLLKAYLTDAMSKEGLRSNNDTCQVWDNHRSALIQYYGLFNPDRRLPFLAERKSKDKDFFLCEGKGITVFEEGFDYALIADIRKRLRRISTFKRKDFSYTSESNRIIDFITANSSEDLSSLLQLSQQLQNNFGRLVSDAALEYNETIRKAAEKVQYWTGVDAPSMLSLREIVGRKQIVSLEVEDDTDDILEEEEQLEILTEREEDRKIFNRIKTIIRKTALKHIKEPAKFTPLEEEILPLLRKMDEVENLQYLGETAVFRRIFEPIVKGPGRLVFNRIPNVYKSYRKSIAENPIKNVVAITIIQEIVSRDNKRLHPEEQSFLIGYINRLLKTMRKVSSQNYDAFKHPYKEAYEQLSKHVIAVDEASDFSLSDLYAIQSLLKPRYSSLTLSGDIMQRLTAKGLQSWETLDLILPKINVQGLVTSYRQSPTLLKIATDIYQRTTGRKSDYQSYMKQSEDEPVGLIKTSVERFEKIEWLAERILDIRHAYGNMIPSIAIFLPDNIDLSNFANDLGDLDELADVGIKVEACKDGKILGDPKAIRVFNIKYIKGLEFEAVFFHDIDQMLESGAPSDMLLRSLYVGLSRATFYTGITTCKDLPADLSFLEDHFHFTGNWRNDS